MQDEEKTNEVFTYCGSRTLRLPAVRALRLRRASAAGGDDHGAHLTVGVQKRGDDRPAVFAFNINFLTINVKLTINFNN